MAKAKHLNNFYIRFDSHEFSLERDPVINTMTLDHCAPTIQMSPREVTCLFLKEQSQPLTVSVSLLNTCATCVQQRNVQQPGSLFLTVLLSQIQFYLSGKPQ